MSPLVRQALGWSLIGAGVIGMLVPMVPGSLFLAIGALLLAPYVRPFRRVSAWFHKHFPNLRGPMRRFREFKVRHARYTKIDANVMSAENGLAKSPPRQQSDADDMQRDPAQPR